MTGELKTSLEAEVCWDGGREAASCRSCWSRPGC